MAAHPGKRHIAKLKAAQTAHHQNMMSMLDQADKSFEGGGPADKEAGDKLSLLTKQMQAAGMSMPDGSSTLGGKAR